MVQGLRKFQRRLEVEIPTRAREAARATLQKNAEELTAEMRRLVPEDDGDLANSIKHREAASSGEARVVTAGDETTIVSGPGYRLQNAFLQEFGTTNAPPTPFFYPSWRKLKRRLKSRLTREVRKAIRRA